MNRNDFLAELTEIMQRDDALTGSEVLSDLEEWDSLATLSVMSFFDMEFSVNLTTDRVRSAKTVEDLINLAAEKLED